MAQKTPSADRRVLTSASDHQQIAAAVGIREAAVQDVDAIFQLQRENLLAGAGSLYSQEVLGKWLENLRSRRFRASVSLEQTFVAVSDENRVIGVAQFNLDAQTISDVWVAPSDQGQGVGRQLVRHCLECARSRGVDEVRAFSALDAIEFYEHLHFERVGRVAFALEDSTAVDLMEMARPVILAQIQRSIEGLRESVDCFAPGKDRNFRLERIVVESFLRGIGASPLEGELVSGEEPVDVRYGRARFQVKAVYDDGRKMHKDYKDKLRIAEQAFFLSELSESYSPRDATFPEIVEEVMRVVFKHGSKYSAEERAALDMLVYVNLLHLGRIKPGPLPDLSSLENEGWRSVSFTWGLNASCVLLACSTAPEFIRAAHGRPVHAFVE